jgi:hypothetical protein
LRFPPVVPATMRSNPLLLSSNLRDSYVTSWPSQYVRDDIRLTPVREQFESWHALYWCVMFYGVSYSSAPGRSRWLIHPQSLGRCAIFQGQSYLWSVKNIDKLRVQSHRARSGVTIPRIAGTRPFSVSWSLLSGYWTHFTKG